MMKMLNLLMDMSRKETIAQKSAMELHHELNEPTCDLIILYCCIHVFIISSVERIGVTIGHVILYCVWIVVVIQILYIPGVMETSSWTYTLDFAFLKLILNIFIVKERKMHTLMLQHKYLFIIVTIFLVCWIKNKVLFWVHISCSTFLSTFVIGKLSFANVIFLF